MNSKPISASFTTLELLLVVALSVTAQWVLVLQWIKVST
jgi:hypothetical protein